MEMKSLEKHLSFNGELDECKRKKCRVYELYNLHTGRRVFDVHGELDSDEMTDSEL